LGGDRELGGDQLADSIVGLGGSYGRFGQHFGRSLGLRLCLNVGARLQLGGKAKIELGSFRLNRRWRLCLRLRDYHRAILAGNADEAPLPCLGAIVGYQPGRCRFLGSWAIALRFIGHKLGQFGDQIVGIVRRIGHWLRPRCRHLCSASCNFRNLLAVAEVIRESHTITPEL
jgi:hypothetical protein